MQIRKEYTYSNNRQIWRILLSTETLIIEERNVDTKEVFFNCIDILSGKPIFKNMQLEEKYWTGIEAVYNEIIFFHNYVKPDMPMHKDIIAYDISSKDILWKNNQLSFLFPYNNLIYCFKEDFSGRKYYALDCNTGVIIEELEEDNEQLNFLKEKSISENNYEGYIFPEPSDISPPEDITIKQMFDDIKKNNVVTGPIEYAIKKDIVLFNYHNVNDDGSLKNNFAAVDLNSCKKIMNEVLNEKAKAYVPDSFFIKDNTLFLLKEKDKLIVCSFV